MDTITNLQYKEHAKGNGNPKSIGYSHLASHLIWMSLLFASLFSGCGMIKESSSVPLSATPSTSDAPPSPTWTTRPSAIVFGATQATSTAIPFPSHPQIQYFADLMLIEYPIISGEADLTGDCDLKEHILSPIYEKIFNEHTRPIGSSPTISEVNAIVKPHGYHVEEEPPDRVYKGDEALLELPLGSPGRISVNQSRTDFIWAIFTDVTGGWLLHGDTVIDYWAFGQFFFVMPQYMGDDLIRLENRGLEEPGRLEVLINEQVVYSQPFVGSITSDCPVEDLKIWNDHWILDMEDRVVMDGQLLSETTGYAEVFEWLLFYDKPLYFFDQGGGFGLVYDGLELPISYEEIAHACRSVMDGRGCSLGIEDYGNMISFFARRDGMWYFVELLKQP